MQLSLPTRIYINLYIDTDKKYFKAGTLCVISPTACKALRINAWHVVGTL